MTAWEMFSISVFERLFLSDFKIFLIQKNKELNLYPLIEKITLLKGRVTVNRTNFAAKEMTPIHYQSDLQIKKNEYGIPEPVNGVEIEINDIDVVIVPMLGFNANGHRLGYGGGFYDRFLSQTKAACIKIGVCHTAEPITIQNIENTDISLDFLISPNGIRKFSNITWGKRCKNQSSKKPGPQLEPSGFYLHLEIS